MTFMDVCQRAWWPAEKPKTEPQPNSLKEYEQDEDQFRPWVKAPVTSPEDLSSVPMIHKPEEENDSYKLPLITQTK